MRVDLCAFTPVFDVFDVQNGCRHKWIIRVYIGHYLKSKHFFHYCLTGKTNSIYIKPKNEWNEMFGCTLYTFLYKDFWDYKNLIYIYHVKPIVILILLTLSVLGNTLKLSPTALPLASLNCSASSFDNKISFFYKFQNLNHAD